MFKKTLRKLTVLNSLVFLLIFIAFTSILYEYLALRLFDKVDAEMQAIAGSFRLPDVRYTPPGLPPPIDPRIFLLLRNADGSIINPNPFKIEDIDQITEIAMTTKMGTPQTQEYQGHLYRMISVPYRYTENVNARNGIPVQEVIAISIVDSEIELLHNLLWITAGGGVIGMLSIILAGYFLAKRAMVPIQAAWKKQQQFVSDASHELRSPITGIHSNAELMLRHPQNTIEEESYRIHTIMKEAKRMTRLISSLLTLARSDANMAELQLEQVDISEIVEIVVAQFKVMEEVKSIYLTSNVQPQIQLLADKERLHQLLVILLDNAFKYTAAGGRVCISCFQSDKKVLITVQDNGLGIAPENLPYIFDRFFRGDKARSREGGGTGLGLSIAEWIVEKHQGKIEVESQVGKGTNFIITFPVIK